jgi:hypothetical protein
MTGPGFELSDGRAHLQAFVNTEMTQEARVEQKITCKINKQMQKKSENLAKTCSTKA